MYFGNLLIVAFLFFIPIVISYTNRFINQTLKNCRNKSRFFFYRETNPTWDVEIRDDVIEECNKHGGVLHVYVDKASPQGNVYVKCPSIATAVAAVNSLHGRWFAGKLHSQR